jgi:transcriptional regulator with XRE-family HTH domain
MSSDDGPVQKPTLRHNIAANVRRLRENSGRSQEALGEDCGLHPGHVGQIERATSDITVGTLERLAAGLGVDPLRLLRPPPKNAKSKPLPRGPKPGSVRRVKRRR